MIKTRMIKVKSIENEEIIMAITMTNYVVYSLGVFITNFE